MAALHDAPWQHYMWHIPEGGTPPEDRAAAVLHRLATEDPRTYGGGTGRGQGPAPVHRSGDPPSGALRWDAGEPGPAPPVGVRTRGRVAGPGFGTVPLRDQGTGWAQWQWWDNPGAGSG